MCPFQKNKPILQKPPHPNYKHYLPCFSFGSSTWNVPLTHWPYFKLYLLPLSSIILPTHWPYSYSLTHITHTTHGIEYRLRIEMSWPWVGGLDSPVDLPWIRTPIIIGRKQPKVDAAAHLLPYLLSLLYVAKNKLLATAFPRFFRGKFTTEFSRE